MGLLNFQSQLDIPQGTNPVGEMNSTQGPSFDLGSNSTIQIDSLQEVPTISLYQDLNGLQGPLFDFGMNSPLHAFSDGLGQILNSNEVPTPGVYTPYQSIVSPLASYGAGQPGGLGWPNVDSTNNSLLGLYPPPAGMLLVSDTNGIAQLLQQIPTISPYQDLNGVQGPQFDFGSENTTFSLIDSLHESSLTNSYIYQHGNSVANIPATTLDLNGQQGQLFDNGPEDFIPSMHENALTNIYDSVVNQTYNYGAGQPSGVWPTVNPSTLSLGGAQGTQFAQQPEPTTGENLIDTIQEIGLEGLYNSVVNPQATYGQGQPGGAWPVVSPSTLDLNGQNGPQFDLGPEPSNDSIDSFHESALINMYESSINPGASYGQGQPGSTWPNVNATSLDMNGGVGPSFPSTLDIHQASLTQNYQRTINSNASYGAGQPGGIWPVVSNAALDIDGMLPNNGEYINNLPS